MRYRSFFFFCNYQTVRMVVKKYRYYVKNNHSKVWIEYSKAVLLHPHSRENVSTNIYNKTLSKKVSKTFGSIKLKFLSLHPRSQNKSECKTRVL